MNVFEKLLFLSLYILMVVYVFLDNISMVLFIGFTMITLLSVVIIEK